MHAEDEQGGHGGGGGRRRAASGGRQPAEAGGGQRGGGGGRGRESGKRGGSGGRGEGRRKDRNAIDEPAWVPVVDRIQTASGLFFILYLVTHLVHQATATAGRGAYEAFENAFETILYAPGVEVLLVWLPLAVHLATTLALRAVAREKRGGLRRQLSVWSGWAVLVLLVPHVWATRVQPASERAFELITGSLRERGVIGYPFLLVFAALACAHLAAGSINSLHKVVRDRTRRQLLDRAIIFAAAVLFAAVVLGIVALGRVASG